MGADPEINAMIAISGAFDALESDARARVLRWAYDKYGSSPLPNRDNVVPEREPNPPLGNESEETPPSVDFDDFADLYDAAAPKSAAEKALVAAYWHQKIKGNDQFGSQPLNNYLKDLGHQLPRINDALAAGMKTTPATVLQVRKSGNAPQGRKMYKVTKEGLRAVDRMITAEAAD